MKITPEGIPVIEFSIEKFSRQGITPLVQETRQHCTAVGLTTIPSALPEGIDPDRCIDAVLIPPRF